MCEVQWGGHYVMPVCVLFVSSRSGIVLNLSAGAINDHSQSAKDIYPYFNSQLYVEDPGHRKPVLILLNGLSKPGKRPHDRNFNFCRGCDSNPQLPDRQSSMLPLRSLKCTKWHIGLKKCRPEEAWKSQGKVRESRVSWRGITLFTIVWWPNSDCLTFISRKWYSVSWRFGVSAKGRSNLKTKIMALMIDHACARKCCYRVVNLQLSLELNVSVTMSICWHI